MQILKQAAPDPDPRSVSFGSCAFGFVTCNEVNNRCLRTLWRANRPGLGNPFSGLAQDRKLTDEELLRAISFTVAAEYEATQM
jgi:hypothetical protein